MIKIVLNKNKQFVENKVTVLVGRTFTNYNGVIALFSV